MAHRFLVLLLYALVLTHSASAFETDTKLDFDLVGSIRQLNQNGFYTRNIDANSTLVSGFQVRMRDSGFQLDFRPEFRALAGPAANLLTTDPGYLSVASPDRFFNLRAFNSRNNSQEYTLDVERLMLSYSSDALEVRAGRAPVSLGVLRIFPVWNKFSRPLPGVSQPVIIYGQDNAEVHFQLEKVSIQALRIEGSPSAFSNHVSLLEMTWFGDFAEVHGLAADWWGENVLGLAISKDLNGLAFRMEGLSIGVNNNNLADVNTQFQGGLGFEYAFDSTWSLLNETFYQSTGSDSVRNYPIIPASRFMSLRAKTYSFLQLNYHASSVWSLSGAGLINLVDYGTLLIARINRSLTDNIDAYLEFDLPVGRDGAEFSTRSISFSDGSSLGISSQAFLGLKGAF